MAVSITLESVMNFRITGLSPTPFQPYFGLPDAELESLAVRRYVVDAKPGFPDRIEMVEAEVGETMLLLNHVCQPAATPYRASHAIFVREAAAKAYDSVNQIPQSMRIRLLSLRGYDTSGMMLAADVVQGNAIETIIVKLFENPEVSYIHVHNAKQGCYAGRIDRV
jgi:hypothetical protein